MLKKILVLSLLLSGLVYAAESSPSETTPLADTQTAQNKRIAPLSIANNFKNSLIFLTLTNESFPAKIALISAVAAPHIASRFNIQTNELLEYSLAATLGFGVLSSLSDHPTRTIAVLTADHFITKYADHFIIKYIDDIKKYTRSSAYNLFEAFNSLIVKKQS